MVRNNLRFVFWKDYKAVTSDLKTITIYQAPTEDAALQAPWDNWYPQISRSGESNWTNLA
ncbi:tnpA domain protein, partial [Candidatus Erwinia dacicola]